MRALGLRLDHYPAGHVGDADRRLGLVDVLAAGTGRMEGVDLEVGRVDLDRRAVLFHRDDRHCRRRSVDATLRSEEHTSELQSLMRISYAVFCLKKKQ